MKKNKHGYEVSGVEGGGFLILPLSMSRLATGQNPEYCYEVVEHFTKRIRTFSNDVIFLYTNGLYFNSEEISFENRKRTNAQVLNHIASLRKMIVNKKQFIPQAFHFVPIDYVIFNSDCFQDFFKILQKRILEDEKFKELVINDNPKKEYSEAGVNFILEELVVGHILRESLVELPCALAKENSWRLLVYPGSALKSEIYVWKNSILPKKDDKNIFNGQHYNWVDKKIEDFDFE